MTVRVLRPLRVTCRPLAAAVRIATLLAALAACGGAAPREDSAAALPANSFAFAVFGDAPYHRSEQEQYRRLLADVRASQVAWMIHVGDLWWYPCSNAMYTRRRQELDGVGVPVVYTPGDNEWTDCHGREHGRHDPLERLGTLRRTFFTQPQRSLGANPLALVSQAADTAFAEFPENARWSRGGFVFATVHIVGSANGGGEFAGRRPAHDAERARRLAAGVAWVRETFAVAHRDSARGVAIALHANIGLEPGRGRRAFAPLVDALKDEVERFPGEVLLVHGDSHAQQLDHPLARADGSRYANFTRLETFGSPDIGWVRVVVDTVAGRFVKFEPRRIGRW